MNYNKTFRILFALFIASNSLCAQIFSDQALQPERMMQNVQFSPIFHQYSDSTRLSVKQSLAHTANYVFEDVKSLYSAPLRMNKKAALWLTGTAAVGGLMYWKDQEIHDGFHDLRRYRFYREHILDAAYDVEKFGLYANVGNYYLGAFAVSTLFKIKPVQQASFELMETFFLATFLRGIISQTTKRARPYLGLGPHEWGVEGSYSFPSGHTSTIFQFAVIASHHTNYKPATFLYYSVATLVGIQRIDHDQHWPSDVVLGAAYGILFAKGVLRLHENRELNFLPTIGFRNRTALIGVKIPF